MSTPRLKITELFLSGIGRGLLAGLGLAAALAATTPTLAVNTETSKPVCGPYGDVPREGSPTASRDGSTLAWIKHSWRAPGVGASVWVSARDGSRARRVSVPDNAHFAYDVTIAPDGNEVLIADALLAHTRRTESRFVSRSEAAEIRRAWRTPEWSPDGRFRVSFDQDGLLIIPAETGPSRRIPTPGLAIHSAAWSPNGQSIVLGSQFEEGAQGIFIVGSDGSGLRRLAGREHDSWGPTWSPDGSLIAFWVDDGDVKGGQSIVVIRPNGGGAKVLAGGHQGPDRRSAREPNWLDSRTLVFSSYGLRGGPHKVADVHTIRVDGRDERRITYQCHLGTYGADVLSGSILGDTIRTFAGNDLIGAGPGPDDVDAGPGNDSIRTVDRDRDLVRCGPGRDRVEADRFDRVRRDCETVIRRRS